MTHPNTPEAKLAALEYGISILRDHAARLLDDGEFYRKLVFFADDILKVAREHPRTLP